MGFECSLAIVLPESSQNLVDFYPSQRGTHEDFFFDRRILVVVPAREWNVFRFINFGQVRTITKSSSSQSPSQRASGNPGTRAAKCTASYLLNKFFHCERAVLEGNADYVVPYIADHLLYARCEHDIGEFNYSNRFVDVFARIHSHDVVSGIWALDKFRVKEFSIPSIQAITGGPFWEHNVQLLKGDISRAVTLEDTGWLPQCGLVWESALEVSRWLNELLVDHNDEGIEIRKNELSMAIVSTWRDTLVTLSSFGARVIFLTGCFHSEGVLAQNCRQQHF